MYTCVLAVIGHLGHLDRQYRAQCVQVVLGLVLFFAGTMKAYPYLNRAESARQTVMAGMLNGLQSVPEVVFGLWLVSGLYSDTSRKIAIVCFAAFAVRTGYSVLSGEESCGCFGAAVVHPWYTFGFDIAAVTALLSAPPSQERCRGIRNQKAGLVGACCCIAMLASATLLGSQVLRSIGAPAIEVLEPEKWVGQRFPLSEHVDAGGQLMSGRWLTVFYRNDCSECRHSDLIPRAQRLAGEWAARSLPLRVCFVEIPSHSARQPLVSPNSAWSIAHLDASREWVGKTPFEVPLIDGLVVASLGSLLEGELGSNKGQAQ